MVSSEAERGPSGPPGATARGAYAVGIDVGTTFTAAAICRAGTAEAVTLGDRGDVIPSVVFLRDDDVLLVGHAAERRAVADPTRVARAFKRRLGDAVPLTLGGRAHTAQVLTAAIVRWVVDLVTAREGSPPDRTVLTLPAGWRDHRCDLVRRAVAEAGVHDPEVLAEPVAAALHYSVRHALAPGAAVGVYDLGGGTFDATIVRRAADGFELVGRPQGDDRLGGIDLDALVWEHVESVVGADALRPGVDSSPVQLRALAQVRAAAIDAKEALSYDTQAVVPITLPDLMTEVRITRTEFEEMARPALLRTVDVFRQTCESAQVEPSELQAVLLVGGSSRIPMISQLVGHALGARVVHDAHPKLATCLGAAHAGTNGAPARLRAPAPVPVAVPGTGNGTAEPDVDDAHGPPPDVDDTDQPRPEVSEVGQPASLQHDDALPPPRAELGAGRRPPPEPDGRSTPAGRDTRRRRRVVGAVAVLALALATIVGIVLTRGSPAEVVPPGEEQAGTTTTAPRTTTTPTTAPETTTATTDGTSGAAPPDGEATTPTVATPPQPATTAPATTAPAPAPGPGAPCDPAAGDPDCTDSAGDGFRIVRGYADCVAALGDGGSCADLDGDGNAGYPDSG